MSCASHRSHVVRATSTLAVSRWGLWLKMRGQVKDSPGRRDQGPVCPTEARPEAGVCQPESINH